MTGSQEASVSAQIPASASGRGKTSAWLPGRVRNGARKSSAADGRRATRIGPRSTAKGRHGGEVAVLRARVKELDKKLRTVVRREERLRRQLKEAEGTSLPARGKLNVNKVSFEQLRLLGLTVMQSARLIAARDRSGGFRSIDELDGVSGISGSTLAELKKKLKARQS